MSMQYPQVRRARLIRPTFIAMCALALLFATPWAARAAGDACHGTAVAGVKGMACPFCAYGLRKHLLAIPGVKNVQVDLNNSEATIEPNSGAEVTAAQIQEAINDAGFSPGQIRCEAKQKLGQVPALFKTAEFTVAGMRCDHCSANITRALERQKGVKSAQVELAAKRATVEYDPQQVGPQALAAVIDHAGKFHAAVAGTFSSSN